MTQQIMKPGRAIKQGVKEEQEKFLEVYKKQALNITNACEAAGISRQTFYNWLEEHPKFAVKINNAQESFKDWVESKIVRAINNDDKQVLMFYAKTKLKDRGYIERVETLNKNISLDVSIDQVKEYLKGFKKNNG